MLTAVLAVAALGCSAGGDDVDSARSRVDSTGTGNTTNGGSTGLPPTGAAASTSGGSTADPVVNIDTTPDATPDDDVCDRIKLEFPAKPRTVYILVDRSTSMWDNQYWDALREGVLGTVEQLQADVRFGLAAYTGIVGQTCPLEFADAGVLDFNAYGTIQAFYQGLAKPPQKSETPTGAAVVEAQNKLLADTFDGPKSILIVTDGAPDFCDDGDGKCRADDLVSKLQAANAQGIRSFVLALPDPSINEQWLTAYANAGEGQPVAAPEDPQFCQGGTLGTYTATMGPATYFQPSGVDADALATELSKAVAGAQSCVFDLENVEIDLDLAGQGTVWINNETIAFDATNGWQLNTPSQLEFFGEACTKVRAEGSVVDGEWPCEAIVVF